MNTEIYLQSLQDDAETMIQLARKIESISNIVKDRLTHNLASLLEAYEELKPSEAQKFANYERALYIRLGIRQLTISVYGYNNLHVARKVAKIFSGKNPSYKDKYYSIEVSINRPENIDLFEVGYKVDSVMNIDIAVTDLRENIPKDILSDECEVVEHKCSLDSYKTIVCPTLKGLP